MNTSDKCVRVLVVDDSPVMRELLVHLIGTDPRLEVAATACDGVAAVDLAQRLRPDVITMDFHMPRMDGLEATRRIMETAPAPIVVVSGSSARDEVALTFRILEAGALMIAEKPGRVEDTAASRLIDTLRLMAEVKVVRRWPARVPTSTAITVPPVPATAVDLLAFGASTGGPQVLQTILTGLAGAGAPYPVPIVIVQHIAPGFTEGYAEWLTRSTGITVRLALAGDTLEPGQAYLAPDGSHLRVDTMAGRFRAVLSVAPPENGHRPSVSHLFRSVAAAAGGRACGVLLTGMGRDGARELKLMKDGGAITIVQSCASSVVPGMPGEAIALDAATLVLAPEQIAPALLKLVNRQDSRPPPAAPPRQQE